MIADCPYISPEKRQHYMMGYNDRCDGNEMRSFENPKLNKAYKRGWKHADS